MYIAIEGVKGCGKSSLLKALTWQLRARGVTFDLLCPTRPMPAESPLEQRLRHRGEQDDALVAEVYAARSNYHTSRVSFRVPLVLGDRSLFTSLASRWHLRDPRRPADHLEAVRSRESLIPYPQHVLYLQTPLSVVQQRLRGRPGRDYGKRDESPERLAMASGAYDDLRRAARSLQMFTTWHDVDATRSPAQVARVCTQHIFDLLQGRSLRLAS